VRLGRILAALLLLTGAMAADIATGVAIYGGTPAGIAAAIAAGSSGQRVLVIEPYRWVGGMVTNGLSHSDYHAHEGLTGAFLAFTRRVHAHYQERYGKDSPQAHGCRLGTQAEPHVNRLVLERMLTEVPSIRVLTRHRLVDAIVEADAAGPEIRRITLAGPDGQPLTVVATVFIDATYEGDLMAKADRSWQASTQGRRVMAQEGLHGDRLWRVGREGRAEYGESLAPEAADQQLQAYNFRLCMTRMAANRVAIPQPAGYDRAGFADLLPLLEKGSFAKVFAENSGRATGFYKMQVPAIPNGKFDINDVSSSAVRLSMPAANLDWPDGDAAARQRVQAAHLRYNLGMLWFIQNDPAVPARYRDEALEWGLCRDEFTDTGHLPEQLYVREARRMIGRYVFTQNDTEQVAGDMRCVFQRDSIAMGEYGPNCHGTGHEGPLFGGRHVGEFYRVVMPYQIPYGVILPKHLGNLLVPVAVSASHVGFCALRLEPIWMSLGQAAGFAASEALSKNQRVQEVAVSTLQQRLRAAGSATIYVSDVLPGSADFVAVQWWGQLGGLHGVEPRADGIKAARGKALTGQYFATYPGHEVGLDVGLDAALATGWKAIGEKAGVPALALEPTVTRGEFIRRAYRTVHGP